MRWPIILAVSVFMIEFAPLALPAQSDSVVYIFFEGQKRTRVNYLKRFIDTEVGQLVDSTKIKRDVQNLLNTDLFESVTFDIQKASNGKGVVYHLKERFSFLPVITAGVIRDNFWIELGVVDFNFLGRGIRWGLLYRYYDRSSFTGFIMVPNWKGSKWGSYLAFQSRRTLEPIYFESGELSDYKQDMVKVKAMVLYELDLQHSARLGFIYERSEFHFDGGVVDQSYPVDSVEVQEKFLLRARYINKHFLNTKDQYQYGWFTDLIAEVSVKEDHNQRDHYKIYNRFSFLKRVGGKGNFAAQLILGFSENHRSPFAPFIQDSFINLRGVGNKVDRGTAEISLNLEYRQTILEHRLGAIQAVGFFDCSSLRQPGEEYNTIFNNSNMNFYSGLGVRLYVRKIYGFTLRMDYGFSLKGGGSGFVFGVGQYF